MVMVRHSVHSSWTVCGGSLSDSVTVDSSTTDPDPHPHPHPHPKSPLLLLRPSPSPDSSPPCEITLNFGQRREVQQVYLRSTARVYEVYFSPNQQPSSPEYLCTVRCSPLTAEEADKINLTAPCEDDWVDVKVLRSSPDIIPSLNNKEFYEATAQISDADPCVSISIRLLSIQSGDHVYVDELYVFAEPVDSAPVVDDNRIESTAGSSLMAMLVPTLLQLSKSGLANQVKGAPAGDRKYGPGPPAAGCDGTQSDLCPELSSLTDTAQPKASDVHSSTTHESPCEWVMDKKSDAPCSCSDTVLNDLLSRVSRIEQICLRFEGNMLRPLSSIEARLAQVEAQLEAMNKKSTGGHGCDKFSTPDCSPSELSLNDEVSLSKPSIQLEETSDSGAAVRFLCRDSFLPLDPSDGENNHEANFPQNEDESPKEKIKPASLSLSSSVVGDGYETDASKQDDESSKVKPKQAMSVDEALAFALAGFVSSIPGHSVKFTSGVAVKAPDFSPEDDEPREEKSSVPSQCNDITYSSTHWTDGSECTKDSHSSALLPHDEAGADDCPCDKFVEKAGEKQDEVQGSSLQVTFDDYWRIGVVEHEEGIAEKSSVFAHDDTVPLQESHQAFGSPCLGEEVTLLGSKVPHGKDEIIMEAKGDVLDDILSFSRDACMVDFESPLLDVKFISEERSYTDCAFESLWSNIPEANGGPTCEGKSNDLSLDAEQENLIVVDDDEAVTCSTNSIDHRYCGLLDMPAKEDVKANFQAGSNNKMLTCVTALQLVVILEQSVRMVFLLLSGGPMVGVCALLMRKRSAYQLVILVHWGNTPSLWMKLTLEHNASAALLPDDLLLRRLISFKVIPWQGWLLLQLNIMASSEALVPRMLLYTTLLTCTADAYQYISVNVNIQSDWAFITQCREELVILPEHTNHFKTRGMSYEGRTNKSFHSQD